MHQTNHPNFNDQATTGHGETQEVHPTSSPPVAAHHKPASHEQNDSNNHGFRRHLLPLPELIRLTLVTVGSVTIGSLIGAIIGISLRGVVSKEVLGAVVIAFILGNLVGFYTGMYVSSTPIPPRSQDRQGNNFTY